MGIKMAKVEPSDIVLVKLRLCKLMHDAICEEGQSLWADYALDSRDFCDVFTKHAGPQFEADCLALEAWARAAFPECRVTLIKDEPSNSHCRVHLCFGELKNE
jgi:hypothetical protein